MSLENQELACVQAFLEDRASERLMTRLLADAGENYAWFRRLAQHMFRSTFRQTNNGSCWKRLRQIRKEIPRNAKRLTMPVCCC